MASNQLIQAIFWCYLKEFFLDSEITLFGGHLFDGITIFIFLHKLETVVGLNLYDVYQPIESIRVAVHCDFNALSLFHF